jgi:hypothetical protein
LDLALSGLGSIDHALHGPNLIREKLAEEIQKAPEFQEGHRRIVGVLLLQGSARHADSGMRASRLRVWGVDDAFWRFGRDGPHQLPVQRECVLNQTTAKELGAKRNDTILLSVGAQNQVPSDLLLGRRDDTVRTLRLKVVEIIPDQGVGRISLEPNQLAPQNLFVSMQHLQKRLELEGLANGILAGRTSNQKDRNEDLNSVLRKRLALPDFGLRLIVDEKRGYIQLESDRMVLDPRIAEHARSAAKDVGLSADGVLTHLANSLTVGERSIPYSTISAIEPIYSIGKIGDQEIVLNSWAANELNAKVGDEVYMAYYAAQTPGGRIEEIQQRFRVVKVVFLEGWADDPQFTPTYEGVTDVKTMKDWKPPFPLTLKIRDEDEEYWKKHKATPKGFISLAAGRSIWSSRHGDLTALRILVGDRTVRQAADGFREALLARLSGPDCPYAFRAVRAEAIAASVGATNFGEYFLYFSFFLIVAALMSAAMLVRLSIEQRGGEAGILLATGFHPTMVMKLLTLEGGVLGLAGSLAGIVGGLGYSWLILWGLRTWWVDAVRTTSLYLHPSMISIAIGFVASLLVSVAVIPLTARRLLNSSARSLMLRRRGEAPAASAPTRLTSWIVSSVLTMASVALAAGAVYDLIPETGAFFGAGAGMLAASVVALNAILRGSQRVFQVIGGLAYWSLGARNIARNPGRSVLTAALMGFALFVIVSVESFRHGDIGDSTDIASGSGGFSIIAESALPLSYHLGTKHGRRSLGISASQDSLLERSSIMACSLRPGDEASCLNLYAPRSPRIVGVPQDLISRGGFDFAAHLDGVEPWSLLNVSSDPNDPVPAIADANTANYVLHLSLGDEFTILDDRGQSARLRIAALLKRSVFQAELLIGETSFRRLFPDRSGHNYFLIDAPRQKTDDLKAVLEETLADYGFDASSTSDRLELFESVENTYLSTFQALGGLGLLLGTAGLGAVMLRNVLQRRGELALLRAVGYPKSGLALLVLSENAALLAIGILIGIGSALIAVAPHWTGKAELSLRSLSWIVGLTAVAGLASGLASILVALRAPLIAAIRDE